MRRMHELGFSVLAIDYRGFGESSDGSGDQDPSEARAYEDARAAWDWLGRAASRAPPLHLRPLARQRHRRAAGERGRRRQRPHRRGGLHLDSGGGVDLRVGLAAGRAADHPALRRRKPHRAGEGAAAGGARQRRPADPVVARPQRSTTRRRHRSASCSSPAARTTARTRSARSSTARRCASCSDRACNGCRDAPARSSPVHDRDAVRSVRRRVLQSPPCPRSRCAWPC